MIRISLFLVLLLCGIVSYGQEQQLFARPNFELIEKVTNDKTGPEYYPKLLARYKRNDTTLTLREYHLLYYGKFFQKDMANPFGGAGGGTYYDSIKAIYAKDSSTDDDRRKLLGYYLHINEESPFDLKTLNQLYSICANLDDTRKIYFDKKLEGLVRTIAATGDGMSEKSGFHIGSISDEYAFLSFLGLKSGGGQSLIGHCDYLHVEENKHDVKGIYFDITQIQNEEFKLFSGSGIGEDFLKELEKEKKEKKKKDKK
jgi:hypothetical protein